jgi:hypothetical protein
MAQNKFKPQYFLNQGFYFYLTIFYKTNTHMRLNLSCKPGGLMISIATGFNPWFRAQCVPEARRADNNYSPE